MLALQLYRDGRCTGCGGDLAVTTNPKNEGKFKPLLPVQCHRCVAFSTSVGAYRDEPHPGSFMHLVPLTPNRRR